MRPWTPIIPPREKCPDSIDAARWTWAGNLKLWPSVACPKPVYVHRDNLTRRGVQSRGVASFRIMAGRHQLCLEDLQIPARVDERLADTKAKLKILVVRQVNDRLLAQTDAKGVSY
jgi:hypothetical protein